MIVITLARKAISSSVARNSMSHGTGGLNIDVCRISTASYEPNIRAAKQGTTSPGFEGGFGAAERGWDGTGRWPSNFILEHRPGCRRNGTRLILKYGSGGVTGEEPSQALQLFGGLNRPGFKAHGNGDGTETVAAWHCEVDCPVAEMDRQSGVSISVRSTGRNGKDNAVATFGLQRKDDTARGHEDFGTASRFFKQVGS